MVMLLTRIRQNPAILGQKMAGSSPNLKRQLPPWMLGSTESEAAALTRKETDERKRSPKLSLKSGRGPQPKGKKKLAEHDDFDRNKIPTRRRAKKPRSLPTSRKPRARGLRFDKDSETGGNGLFLDAEDDIVEDSDDEENGLDLTVDDLITIAKQHVETHTTSSNNQDNESYQEDQLKIQKESSTKAASIFSNRQWKDLSDNSSVSENNYFGLAKPSKEKETGVTEISQSQNCSQFDDLPSPRDVEEDMIDLLLGPSLGSLHNDSKISHNSSSQVNDFLQSHLTDGLVFKGFEEVNKSSNLLSEDACPLPKKKSSLRDKVTMLLN
eukprot:TRINITY_DN27769_c0_g1_i1.p1 TRINITY_DN27769_c0_g1~~TRINITY_DN27769_c0_g1_i1.p1  ORF type:complete len:325 (-),score=65.08 TRINITY_DN27769_c0_g1_i1:3-977(-)